MFRHTACLQTHVMRIQVLSECIIHVHCIYGMRQKKLYVPFRWDGIKKLQAGHPFTSLLPVHKLLRQCSKPAKWPSSPRCTAVCMGQMYRASRPVKWLWESCFITSGSIERCKTTVRAVKPPSEHCESVFFLQEAPLRRCLNTTVFFMCTIHAYHLVSHEAYCIYMQTTLLVTGPIVYIYTGVH